ncbi:MAG: hypothetical protein VX690_09240 [Pseudomonadota bacterium]|nr:hypothetical protein [Pseudomonadota bacterium]
MRYSSPQTVRLITFSILSLVILPLPMVWGQESFEVVRNDAGKPDFSGIYEWPQTLEGDARGCCTATVFDRKYFAPLREDGEAFLEPRTGDPRHDEPRNFCMPSGFPSGILSAYAMRWQQSEDYLIMVHEFQRMTRIIPLDGRSHRDYIEPSYYGDPVGHWEGDTLIIETTNFKRWGLDDYFYTDSNEYRMHSDALRTIERISWKSADTLRYVLTIDDPKIFSAAWAQEFEIRKRPEWDEAGIVEYVCQENNRCAGGACEGN